MYCKACGKKINPGTDRCPHCGRNADFLSGGTGFWDIHEDGQRKATQTTMPAEHPEKREHNNSDYAKQQIVADPVIKKKLGWENRLFKIKNIKYIIICLIALILLITTIRDTNNVGRLNKRLVTLEAEQQTISDRMSILEDRAEEIAKILSDDGDNKNQRGIKLPGFIPPTDLKLNLHIDDGNPNDDGIYMIAQDTTAVWNDIGSEEYLITITEPDGEPFKDSAGNVYQNMSLGKATEQKILIEVMKESGQYSMQIKAQKGNDEEGPQDIIYFQKVD